jgi:hypothetical protein
MAPTTTPRLLSLTLLAGLACASAERNRSGEGGSGGSDETGGATATGGATGTGGAVGTGGSGRSDAAAGGAGGAPAATDAAPEPAAPDADSPVDSAGGGNVAAIAGELDGAFLEPKCVDKPSNGFCHHSGVIEQKVKFGGETGKNYQVTLNVWGILEGLRFSGGQPAGDHFYTGGMSITPRYSPCALKVGTTSYFLNRKEDRANDKVYPFVYTTPAIQIPGQADLLLYCTDDASKHISINNPPPLMQAANGRHTIANPPPRLAARLGTQPYAFTFFYLEVATAKLAE